MWRVLQSNALYDVLLCMYCQGKVRGKGFKEYPCPRCGTLPDMKHPIPRSEIVVCFYAYTPLGEQCFHCLGPMIMVPPEGHPNSPFTKLPGYPNQVLIACKAGCRETKVGV